MDGIHEQFLQPISALVLTSRSFHQAESCFAQYSPSGVLPGGLFGLIIIQSNIAPLDR